MNLQNLKLIKEILENEFLQDIENGYAKVSLGSDFEDSPPHFVVLDILGEEYYFGDGLPEDISEEEIVKYVANRIKQNNL